MDETVKWAHLKPDEIARLLGHEGIKVSVTVVDQGKRFWSILLFVTYFSPRSSYASTVFVSSYLD
jgi:hypothetical protein